MDIFFKSLIFLMAFGGIVFFSIVLFGALKYMAKTLLANWKFPDYISVSYFEHLVNKYIKHV